MTSFSTKVLWLAGEITFLTGTRISQVLVIFFSNKRTFFFFLTPITSGSLAGFLILFILIVVGTEEEKTLAVCTIGEALRQDKAGSPKRCAIKEKVARLWFKTVFHKGIVPILRSLAASNAESFSPPPTVSLLGSRLLWMCHNCWIPNLKEMRPFYFSAGLRQQLQSESNIYLRRATASLTFNTGHKNITIKALKSAVKHGVTCHWDLLLLLLLPLLYPLLMAKQRLISKPPKKKKRCVFH